MEDKIQELFDIVTELEAREKFNILFFEGYFPLLWEELCDKGIQLFEEIKKG